MNMNDEIVIEKEKVIEIIKEVYKQIYEKETNGQTKTTSIEKIVEFMKGILKDDDN